MDNRKVIGLILIVIGAIGTVAFWPWLFYSQYAGPAWQAPSNLPPWMMGWMQPGMMGPFAGGYGYRVIARGELESLLASSTKPALKADNTLVYKTKDVRLVVLAGPMEEGMSMYSFVIEGLVNPTIVVPAGSRLTIVVINVDTDAYHDLAISVYPPPYPYMARHGMMMRRGAAMSMMLPPSSQGLYYLSTLSLSLPAGVYYYLCTVPGHAANGMYGTIEVRTG